jgi:hypothetical protein
MNDSNDPRRPPANAAPPDANDLHAHPDLPDDMDPDRDDAIIGVALRWSLLVIVVVAAIVGGVWFMLSEGEKVEKISEKDLVPVEALQTDEASMPDVPFVDITREAGISFVHRSGATGEKLLPETMGGGVAFLDYDSDGDQDLLFISGSAWPHNAPADTASSLTLYANDGDGAFTDVTDEAGLHVPGLYGFGPAVGDIDNDGDSDFFIACLGVNHLFRNDGGTFTEISAVSRTMGSPRAWSSSAGFFDYDNDGLLDLFVCNYIEWSRELDIENSFSLNGEDRAYGPPTNFRGAQNQLLRNLGNGTFEDVSESAGIFIINPLNNDPVGKALALRPADVNRDGWMDILVANDTVQNFFFLNNGDGTFMERGDPSGIAFSNEGGATGAMGIDSAHYRNDNAVAFAIGNFAKEMTSFYVAQTDDPLFFSDESSLEGIGSPSRIKLSFGLVFFDVDLDGRPDLLQANGHLEETIQEIFASQTYLQEAQLFWNCGPEARSCYAEMPAGKIGDLASGIVGRGLAYADIDSDGDLDVVLTQTGGAPLLLRNDQALKHHWLRVQLRGTASNRDAIGAEVSIAMKNGTVQRQDVMPTRSYLSQVEKTLTFGLGATTEVESVHVRWPNGTEQDVPVAGVDRVLTIDEPTAG